MAINDNATLVVTGGHLYHAPVGTAIPSDLLDPGADWTEFGHTSLEDIFAVSSEGGDATTIGTLQNTSLRTSYANRTETFSFNLQQFDADSLKLFVGANANVGSSGEVQVPLSPTPTQKAFLAVFVDGDNVFGIHALRSEILRGDDMSIGDTESLASLPIAVKPLAHNSNKYAYSIIPVTAVTPPSGP